MVNFLLPIVVKLVLPRVRTLTHLLILCFLPLLLVLPITFTMAGPGPNTSGNPDPNAGTITSGTATGTPSTTPFLPFIEGLSLPDLNQLINDPICHDVSWPAMPTKLVFDIPKLEGLAGEDPSNHI